MAQRPEPETSTVEKVGRPSWFVPVITFVVGLVLGGLVMTAVRSGDEAAGAGAGTPTVATAPAGGTGGPTTATLVVPADCLKVSNDASNLGDLARRAVQAARDLDASELSTVVREIDTAQSTLRQHASACRDSKAAVTGGPVVPTTPATTPAP